VASAEAIRQLRMLAVDLEIDRHVGADRLIRAGLDALLAGVEAPSLPLLAGLSRNEEPDARPLFHQVVDELGLAPDLPVDRTARRWALVRWWAQLVVDGALDPGEGGYLIWQEGWSPLGHPDALRPVVGEVVQLEDWASSGEVWDDARKAEGDRLAARIVHEARKLLDGPWPAPEPPPA
jgi:hypothetical protein